MKQRFVRVGDEISDDTTLVIRGGDAQDDDGRGWSTLSSAVDPSNVALGAILVAGNAQARAAVRVIALDND